MVPPAVRHLVDALTPRAAAELPAYICDLASLRAHASAVRAAVPPEVELFYAVKANPDPVVLSTLEPWIDGTEVASGGELAHVRTVLPHARLAFGGPGKTEAEIHAALSAGVDRVHVESLLQLRQVAATAERLGVVADVLLRMDLPIRPERPAPLIMSGRFGLDPASLPEALDVASASPAVRLRGIHAHLVSGLGATELLATASHVLGWAIRAGVPLEEVNLGGGMAVDYARPDERFDWRAFGIGLQALAATHPGIRLRIEPGRALTAYAGFYATRVLDVRSSAAGAYVVVAGGTHHLRTPAARQHSQPFEVLPVSRWGGPGARPGVAGAPVTVVGQLCTPKDVLAAHVPVAEVRAGDILVFGLTGAYSWNISHRDFLMHPPPRFHHVGAVPARVCSTADGRPRG